MNVDEKTEIIRKALEEKYGKCEVNMYLDNNNSKGAIFFCHNVFEIESGYKAELKRFVIPKEFIEVLPLVDLEGTRSLVEHIADLVKDQKQYIKKCECRILELSDKLRKATENQPLVDKKEK